jgi:hypothetical protein
MNKQEHIEKHIKLHEALNELFNDFVRQNPLMPGKYLDQPIATLFEWSEEQTTNPTDKRY